MFSGNILHNTYMISNIQSLYHTLTVPCDADLMQRKCDKMKIQVRGTTSWLASPIPGTPLILPSVLVHSSHQGLLATCDAQPFKGWSISISCYVGIRLQLHRVQPFFFYKCAACPCSLGEPSNRLIGKIWDFVPTRSTPPPPRKLGHQKLNFFFFLHFRLF